MKKITITVHDKAAEHLEAEARKNLKFKNKVSEVVHDAVMKYLAENGYNMTGEDTIHPTAELIKDALEETTSNFDEEPAVKEVYKDEEIGPGLNDSDTLL